MHQSYRQKIVGKSPDKTQRTPTTKLRILILEDHPVFMKRLTSIIETWPRETVIVDCATLGEASRIIESHSIDLLLADLMLPDGSGIDAVHLLRQRQPQSQALVISALARRDIIISALKSGATGYIHKEDSNANIIAAIEQILAGGSPLSPAIAREILRVLDETQIPDQSDTTETGAPETYGSKPMLTAREQEVLNAISRGSTNREVADILAIAEATVPVHVRNIYRKLEVKNRTAAIFEARKRGILND